MPEGDFKNEDKKEAGEGAPLFHTMCRSKNLVRAASDESGSMLKHRLD